MISLGNIRLAEAAHAELLRSVETEGLDGILREPQKLACMAPPGRAS